MQLIIIRQMFNMWKEIISKGMFCLFFEQIVMKKKSQLLTYLVFSFFFSFLLMKSFLYQLLGSNRKQDRSEKKKGSAFMFTIIWNRTLSEFLILTLSACFTLSSMAKTSSCPSSLNSSPFSSLYSSISPILI